MLNTQLSNEDRLKKEVERWLNIFQMMVLAARPRVLTTEAGRRGGKTEEIGAERSLRAALEMAGSSGFIAARSYSKLLDHMIPGLEAGWNKRGMVEGEDYVIASAPPKHFKRPIIAPKSFDHYILFRWGSGIHMISFDHGVTSNGLSTDWGLIDEAKQLDPVRVNSELLRTMSGHRTVKVANSHLKWGDLPGHRSLTLLTDKFIGKNDYKWVDGYKKDSMTMQEFMKLAAFAQYVQNNPLPYLQDELRKRQCAAQAYIEYSSRANLPVLGIEYFRDQFKNSSNLDFRVSILNDDVAEIEGGFYQFLDETIHTYEARNNDRIDTIGIREYLNGNRKDCLLDNDWRKDLPLEVGIDYGSEHTWFVSGQEYAETLFVLNNFWTTNEQISEGVDKLCRYYKHHEHKVVHVYDDPGGHKKKTDQSKDIDEVIKAFRKNGWMVIHKTPDNNYIPHKVKYRIYQKGLDERLSVRDKRYKKLRFNINNAYQTFYSCSKAPVKLSTNDEYTKDKSSEKDKSLDQWKATHLSDALDNIYCTKHLHLVDGYKEWQFVY